MTGGENSGAVLEARLAVHDYLSVGSEPDPGEIEREAIDEWLEPCLAVDRNELSPEMALHMGWMYVERGWSYALENEDSGSRVPDSVADLVSENLDKASPYFYHASQAKNGITAGYGELGRSNINLFRFLLTGKGLGIREPAKESYTGFGRAAEAMLHGKEKLRLSDVPHLNALAGIAMAHLVHTEPLLTYNDCYEIIVPSASRHFMGRDSTFTQWHGAIFDRDKNSLYRIRVAPEGPHNYISIPPVALLNEVSPIKALPFAGTLQVYPRFQLMINRGGAFNAKDKALQKHVDLLKVHLEPMIDDQLASVRKYQTALDPERIKPEDALQWFRTLSPYLDPAHHTFGGALEAGISFLEYTMADSGLGHEDKYSLAWMHLESALSSQSQHERRLEALIGSFDRAEELCQEIMAELPEDDIRHHFVELTSITAPLYKAILSQNIDDGNEFSEEDIDNSITRYNDGLLSLLERTLAYYDSLKDPSDPDAASLAGFIHRITLFKLGTDTPHRNHILLAASPRQYRSDMWEGWDYTIWGLGHEGYTQSIFRGRLNQAEVSPFALDEGVVGFTVKMLGQPKLSHNLVTSRTLVAVAKGLKVSPDNAKRLARVKASVDKFLTAATE